MNVVRFLKVTEVTLERSNKYTQESGSIAGDTVVSRNLVNCSRRGQVGLSQEGLEARTITPFGERTCLRDSQLHRSKRKSKLAGASLRKWDCRVSEMGVFHSAGKIQQKVGPGHEVG